MPLQTEYNKTFGTDPYKICHIDWIVNQVIVADFSPTEIDVSDFDNGSIHVSWTGYDGNNGALNIQGSTDGINWDDDGGAEAALEGIKAGGGDQLFRMPDIGYKFIRFRFYLGAGTTATLNASYLFKARRT